MSPAKVLGLSLLVVGFGIVAQEPVEEVERQRLTDRTYIFSRSQLKYGLERNDYLARWVDRPLFTNPALQKEGDDGPLNPASFRRMREVAAEYGLDGLAFFPESAGRQAAFALMDPEEKFLLLPEFGSRGDDAKKIEIAGQALKSPNTFRIGGKVVITSYGADNLPPSHWQDLFGKIREKWGDHFIFLPALTRFGGRTLAEWVERFDQKEISPEDIAKVKDGLREWARATDGLYFASVAAMKKNRQFHPRFYEEFVIRNMKEVLSEPEFRGKYFGLSVGLGHENCTRFGYTLSSNGTGVFRQSLETALAADPDFINIPEWDEQNENTSLRPTVYNSLSSQRILRSYVGQLHGKKPEPLPGDDTSIPNLVLSYRKILTVGEKLEIEVLNIPDTMAKEKLTVRVILDDSAGKTVFTSEDLPFDQDHLMEHRVTIPSETLASNQVLVPRLEVESTDGKQEFSEGFHYIELRPTWNWDYKWVKQPLRDLLESKVAFVVGEEQPDGTRPVEVDISTGEPLAYVEVLDNDDVVYSHSENEISPRETAEHVVLNVSWQSMRRFTLRGSLSVQHSTEEAVVNLNGETSNHWRRDSFLSIPRNSLDTAVLKIDLPEIFQGEMPVKDIIEKGIVGIPGKDGFNLVISRFVRQHRMPEHLDQKAAKFSVPWLPDQPASILHVQAIGKSGRLYRSRPFVIPVREMESKPTVVFSDSAGLAIPVKDAGSSVPEIHYEFLPDHGSILRTSAGRMFWGILGGYVSQATARGGGEANDGSPFFRAPGYPVKERETHPEWVKLEDGNFALQFNGRGNFVTLPQGVIPRRSAFTLSMDVKPESVKGDQILLANRSGYPGSFSFGIRDGGLYARFLGETHPAARFDSSLRLEPNKWQHLVITYDGERLKFSVDGKESSLIEVKGPGIYDTVSSLGGFGDAWFHGQIKSLAISHVQETKP